MEQNNNNTTNFYVGALSDEELEKYKNIILETQAQRRKEKREKELAEQKRKAEELKNKRKERAKEVEEAYKEACEKQKKADELMRAFIRDYGYFHATIGEAQRGTSLLDFLLSNLMHI